MKYYRLLRVYICNCSLTLNELFQLKKVQFKIMLLILFVHMDEFVLQFQCNGTELASNVFGASSRTEVFESLQTQIFLGPEAGSIIGRGGEVIKSIRDESR